MIFYSSERSLVHLENPVILSKRTLVQRPENKFFISCHKCYRTIATKKHRRHKRRKVNGVPLSAFSFPFFVCALCASLWPIPILLEAQK